jgi:hypothetical protein
MKSLGIITMAMLVAVLLKGMAHLVVFAMLRIMT